MDSPLNDGESFVYNWSDPTYGASLMLFGVAFASSSKQEKLKFIRNINETENDKVRLPSHCQRHANYLSHMSLDIELENSWILLNGDLE